MILEVFSNLNDPTIPHVSPSPAAQSPWGAPSGKPWITITGSPHSYPGKDPTWGAHPSWSSTVHWAMPGASPPRTVQPLGGYRDTISPRGFKPWPRAWLHPQRLLHWLNPRSAAAGTPKSHGKALWEHTCVLVSPVLQAPWVGITPASEKKKKPDVWFLAHFGLKKYKQEALCFGKGQYGIVQARSSSSRAGTDQWHPQQTVTRADPSTGKSPGCGCR